MRPPPAPRLPTRHPHRDASPAPTAPGGLLVCLLVCLSLFNAGVHAEGDVLDDFRDLGAWRATASGGARVDIAADDGHDGAGMRVDFDLGSGGYVIVHRDLPTLDLPDNYAFSFYLRGAGGANNLEFKLLDPAGRNVWWQRTRDYAMPARWQRHRVRKVELEYAWGPHRTPYPRQVGGIEFAISAGAGGRGSVWISDLRLDGRAVAAPASVTPVVSASSTAPGYGPVPVPRPPGATGPGWHSDPADDKASVLLDLGASVEFGGVTIHWDRDDFPTGFRLLTSEDGRDFEVVHEATHAVGGRSDLYIPDAEARFVRLEMERPSRGRGFGIDELRLRPYTFSRSANDFFAAIARESPRGLYPRYLLGEQSYWTVVGTADGTGEALLNEDGALEVARGGFSLEPFLYVDGELLGWDAGETHQSLADGYLPIPSVQRQHGDLGLQVTGFASNEADGSVVFVRYQVRNDAASARHARLFVALRPFQVNPPWQSLNMVGGVSRISALTRKGRVVWAARSRPVVPLTPADGFGAASLDQGAITDHLARGVLPPRSATIDELGFASGAFAFDLDIPAGATRDVYLAVPMQEGDEDRRDPLPADAGPAFAERRLQGAVEEWHRQLDRIDIRLPPGHRELVDTLRTTLGYILVNRDGPAIRPGTRDYARSWIRDGAITAAALLETGHPDEVRDFLRWYVRFQFDDGRIPCCVDARGPDSVAENDSNGEFIYAVANYYRYTADIAFAREMWPAVLRAVAYIEYLRSQGITDEYRSPDLLAYYGLAPESISHEGYSSRPVHSYWDNFFLLRGLKDATMLAEALDESEQARHYATLRDAFRHDLYASIERAGRMHDIDFIPGAVELGDFDPTSTSIAVSPGGELGHLPQPALARTFERYMEFFLARRSGRLAWEAYTPYELRNVGTLVRLGERENALQALEYFLADRRPLAWNQWAEVVWREPRTPRFIGDMPHTWVGSGYIRSLLSMFVYARESDRALVLGAGLPRAWLEQGDGVSVAGLPTPFGPLAYSIRRSPDGAIRVHVADGLQPPPGGVVLKPPLEGPIRAVEVDGLAQQDFPADAVVLHTLPAEVVIRQ